MWAALSQLADQHQSSSKLGSLALSGTKIKFAWVFFYLNFFQSTIFFHYLSWCLCIARPTLSGISYCLFFIITGWIHNKRRNNQASWTQLCARLVRRHMCPCEPIDDESRISAKLGIAWISFTNFLFNSLSFLLESWLACRVFCWLSGSGVTKSFS